MSKVDPRLQLLQQEQTALPELEATGRFGLEAAETNSPKVKVLLQYRGSVADLQQRGLEVRTVAGDIISGVLELSRLDEITALPDVIRIESTRPMVKELNLSVPETRANLVQNGSPAYKGAGVIIGIIDSGIDYTHRSFRTADGKSRILAIWDQNLEPIGEESSPARWNPRYAYGVEYTKADIDAALAIRRPFLARHQDNDGHGTHVAGIAAGNGSIAGNGQPAGTFVGMAPEADIIVVANRVGSEIFGDSAETLDAIGYIFDQATALGKPVVINLSQGDNLGPHDGTSLLEQGIDNLLGAPGRAMVKSAGNEGDLGRHASGNVPVGGQTTVQFTVDNNDASPNIIDIWYAGSDRFNITLTAPDGNTSVVVQPDTANTLTFPNGNQVSIVSTLNNPNNSDNQIYIQQLRGTAATIQRGNWSFTLTGVTVSNGNFNAWIERGHPANTPQFLSPYRDDLLTISIPGTSKEVISVASYITSDGANKGNISSFSSRGMTRDRRQKPEIAAPGQEIMSALVGASGTNQYQGLSGTSMAAPHVTGAVALMLQRNRSLTQSQILDYLTKTARRDTFTGAMPNSTWGYGKLDAKAAVDLVPAPQLRTVPVYEYQVQDRVGRWRFFYSRSANVMDGWIRSGREFLAFGEKVEGTVPVYRFSADTPWRFQYSRSLNAGGEGWHNDGIAFYAYADAASVKRPVYQYSAQNPWRFRYSTAATLTDSGWRNDGVAFYIPVGN
jgi:subtilisin family serine protease